MIVQNNREKIFQPIDLPLLIHGLDGTGVSFFSLAVINQLFQQIRKIVFICSFDEARNEFLRLNDDSKAIYIDAHTPNEQLLAANVLFIKPRNIDQLSRTMKVLKDSKYIIYLKNVENINEETLVQAFGHSSLVVTGNYIHPERDNIWSNIVLFSPIKSLSVLPDLPKYAGYLISNNEKSIVKVV